MYLLELEFLSKKDGEKITRLQESRISWYLMLCRFYGRVLGRPASLHSRPNVLLVFAPEADAMDVRLDQGKMLEAREAWEREVSMRVRVLDEGRGKCVCSHRIGVEMRLKSGQKSSPFTCLSCGKPIALYDLPNYEGGSLEQTVFWQDTFLAMLDLNDTVAYDDFTSEQLLDYRSKLNQDGQKVAAMLRAKVDYPVYYRLFEIDEVDKLQKRVPIDGPFGTRVRVCPACGEVMRRWEVANETIEVCDECMLSSAEEVMDEDW